MTPVPMIAIPVSPIGTFALMKAWASPRFLGTRTRRFQALKRRVGGGALRISSTIACAGQPMSRRRARRRRLRHDRPLRLSRRRRRNGQRFQRQPRAEAFAAYKNRKRGAWLRGSKLRLTNAVMADNSIGVTFVGANAVLRDSRIVGSTANQTGPPKLDDAAFPIRGFEFYDGQVGAASMRCTRFCSPGIRSRPPTRFFKLTSARATPTAFRAGRLSRLTSAWGCTIFRRASTSRSCFRKLRATTRRLARAHGRVRRCRGAPTERWSSTSRPAGRESMVRTSSTCAPPARAADARAQILLSGFRARRTRRLLYSSGIFVRAL